MYIYNIYKYLDPYNLHIAPLLVDWDIFPAHSQLWSQIIPATNKKRYE